MAEKKTRPIPQSPAERIAEHKRQMVLQVWFPLMAGIAIVLTVCTLVLIGAATNSSEISRLADISAIYLMIPQVFIGVIVFVIVAAIVYGLSKLLIAMPGWLHTVQAIFVMIFTVTRQISDKLVSPFLAIHGFWAGVKTAKRKIIHPSNFKRHA
jgi:hypothetical protein